MSAFEYASGLISIVVGLAVARALGGVGTFSVASDRSASDWIVVSWCLAILLVMVGWWMTGWTALRVQAEIAFSTLFVWIVASALLYLAAYVLVPGTSIEPGSGSEASLRPVRSAFYLYLAAHFALAFLLGLTQGTFVVTDGASSTALLPSLIPAAMMTGLSAVGAALHSERSRALHLVIWVTALAVVIGQSALTLG
ncbi:MAG: hypothetical protein JRG92_19125 [Deltaproteobacteria bacterium]|nr:hypothetical protein [Deltaproteobacteria bacterium]